MTSAPILTGPLPARSLRSAAAGALLGAAVLATAAGCGHAANRPAPTQPPQRSAPTAGSSTPRPPASPTTCGVASVLPAGRGAASGSHGRRTPGRAGRRPDHRERLRDVHRER